MAVWRSKGTVLKQTISMSLTTVAQVLSIGIDGTENETFETTTLDQASAWKTHAATGYTEPGSVSAELFWDPGLAGHHSLLEPLSTPGDKAYQIVWSDTGTTQQDFTGCGLGVNGTAQMNDGLKLSVTIKIDGDADWADST